MIPYGRQWIDEDDIAAVVDVLRGDYLTSGPVTERFEHVFADKVRAKHAVACANGTAALHLAAMTLGLGEGDVIIIPTLTFLATANAARYVGAEVQFCDVDAHSGLMTTETLIRALEAAEGRRVKAVFPVHLNGQAVDMAAIKSIAARHGLSIVEDGCHALGTCYRDSDVQRQVGSCYHGDMTVFSMHPVKTVAMGEGGVVSTNSDSLAERLRRFRNHGMVRDHGSFVQPDEAFDSAGRSNPWYYEMPVLGFNYRASEIHCALGLSQIAKLSKFVQRRAEIVELYTRLLASLRPVVRPVAPAEPSAAQVGWHLFVVHIDFDAISMSRAELMRALKERGIGSQVHYLPVHRQPYYRQRYGEQHLPGADAYYESCLSLPLFPAMTDSDVDFVATTLAGIVRRGR